jgi:hypothetical protein
MLAALAPPPQRRWPLVALAAAALLGVAATAFALRHRDSVCDDGDDRIAGVLDAVRGRLAAPAGAAFEAYGRAWAKAARDACVATRRGEQSGAMLDLKMACLDRRLDELDALATAAAAAPADVQIRTGFELPPLEPCTDRDQLAAVLPPAPSQSQAVADLRKRLAQIGARQKTTAYREALDDARAAADDARALRYGPAIANALDLVAKLEMNAGHPDAADATIKSAIAAAAEGRDDALLAELWTTRIFVASERNRADEALAYAEAAESEASHLANPSAMRGMIRSYVAAALLQQDKLPEARASAEQAVQFLESALGPGHPRLGAALTTLADVCTRQRDLPAARRHAERAVHLFEATANDQDVAVALQRLANVSSVAGDLERALREYRDALARTLRSAGPSHLYTASAHTNVGDVLRKLGRADEARIELEAARAIYEQTTGLDNEQALLVLGSLAKLEPDPTARRRLLEDLLARELRVFGERHHHVADTLNDLGNTARDAGDLDGAAALFRRALAGFEATLGPTHPRVAIALSNLGEVSIARGALGDAADACARALAIDEKALGPSHPDLAYDLTCLGEARGAAGGIELLERALALRTSRGAPDELARTQFALARALATTNPQRARQLAHAARDHADTAQRAAIDRWLVAAPMR